MLRIPVTYDLTCEVKQDMEYCLKNPYHCVITRNGSPAAIVLLNPVSIKRGADLLDWEREEVMKVVTENQYDIEEAYRRIISGW